MSLAPALAEGLVARLGPRGALFGPEVPEAARSDWSRTGRHLPPALLRPASTEEVAAALALCHRHRQPVVVQGGMTGLAGGANPCGNEVALSLARLAGVEEIDADAGAMVVRAGTVLAVAQEEARAAGFLLPVDLGARGSAQVGGLVATNAGGLRVIRHGTMRDNLLGLEAVLADGRVLSHLSRTVKDNTGYDLRHLICGSEGTLAVITRAVIRLRPLPPPGDTALCALASFEAVLALLGEARRRATVAAYEVMWRDYLALNQELLGRRPFPDPPPFAVLIETEGPGLAELLGDAHERGILLDALVARSTAEARGFWELREGLAMDDALPGLVNLDVALAPGRMAAFAEACAAGVRGLHPGAHVSFYGHVGDGNLHVAAAIPGGGPDAVHAVERIAYDLVRDLGGSISAEHGIGLLKRDWLGHSRSPGEIAAMRALKAALDPLGLLNPGKVLPRAAG
ncbi:MAG: FAD-binding oxidoreductase [Rhodobacteraceae bacterium]|nr:FAD-binding oxidoreductase [Paracoccaceae bacterium]